MLAISDLDLGFSDAENYRHRESKTLFNQLFIRTAYIDELCKRNIYFLIGDKGMGKTAHAIFMSNSPYYKANSAEAPFNSSLNFIRETEYEKFVQMKKQHHLQLSDYSSIWTVILYLLIAKQISQVEKIEKAPLTNWMRFRHLEKAIDEYYLNAFSPEIISAIDFVEDASVSAKLVSDHMGEIGGEKKSTKSFSENRFQVNLRYLQKEFEKAFTTLKLEKNHILFIDGIDIRPSPIKYEEYLECVKGLANAIWKINNDFFPSIRDSKGRMRVVLLMRPDIFDSLGLQNQNNKIRDNSVVLNWLTTYDEYRRSELFAIVDRLLAIQQNIDLELGQAWDYYFPFKISDRSYKARQGITSNVDDSPFIEFIRISFHRPRDIVSALDFLKRVIIQESKQKDKTTFTRDDIENSSFRRDYSQYLLGEIKDQLSFYHTNEEYKIFRSFFSYLDGKIEFSYEEYESAYQKMRATLDNNNIPVFFETKEAFLQFIYELNVICYIQYTESGHPHIHWCFRDRTPTNLSPRIKTGVSYRVHYGLAKALDIGQKLKKKSN